MKTAILKTNLWDDDEFYELNMDTKLLYLLLMSAPERGVSDIYAVSDRILSARSGLNDKQLAVCKNQLQGKGLVLFSGKFIKLSGSAYVMPKKGRFTEQALEREASEVPGSVIEAFDSLTSVNSNSSLIVEHYDNTIHKDIDNNKDVDKDNNKDKSKPEINDMFTFWEETIGYPVTSNRQRNRNACSNLLKKYHVAGLKQLINATAASQSDKYAPRVSDFISLQSKINELLAWAKRKGTVNAPAQF